MAVDLLDVVRDYLLADGTIAGLVSTRVYAGRDVPPSGYAISDGPALTVRVRGGRMAYDDPLYVASVQTKCYGGTALAADTLYRAVFDRLHNGRNGNILHAEIEMLGQQLEEPDTEWPFTLAYFMVMIRNN